MQYLGRMVRWLDTGFTPVHEGGRESHRRFRDLLESALYELRAERQVSMTGWRRVRAGHYTPGTIGLLVVARVQFASRHDVNSALCPEDGDSARWKEGGRYTKRHHFRGKLYAERTWYRKKGHRQCHPQEAGEAFGIVVSVQAVVCKHGTYRYRECWAGQLAARLGVPLKFVGKEERRW